MHKTKFCNSCNSSKTITQFYKNARSKSRLSDYCKTCSKKKSKEYRDSHKGELKESRSIYLDRVKSAFTISKINSGVKVLDILQ